MKMHDFNQNIVPPELLISAAPPKVPQSHPQFSNNKYKLSIFLSLDFVLFQLWESMNIIFSLIA